MKRNLSVNLPEELDRVLDEQAKRELTSKSAIVRRALARHVNEEAARFSRRKGKGRAAEKGGLLT